MASRPPPPWIFAFTGTPYGAAGTFTGAIMPYLAKRAGANLGDIGWYVALLFVPTFLQFTYAPVVDFGPKRKHWLILLSVIGAILMMIAVTIDLREHISFFLAFAFAAQFVTGLVGSCNGGLMATLMSDATRGKAGGWYNVGNLVGGGGLSALVIYLTGHGYPLWVNVALVAGFTILPALAALAIDEPAREATQSTLGIALRGTLAEVRDILTSRAGLTGILLCISPVGTAALSNFFTAIADEFVRHDLASTLAAMPVDAAAKLLDQETSSLTAFVTGPLGLALIAIGSVGGGFICDRTNRRAIYLLSGLLTAVVGILIALSPPTRVTFTVGVLAYQLVTGLCYAAFTATVLETIGKDAIGSATRYSMFTAAGNVAITYTGKIDSAMSEKHGLFGVFASDAILNVAGVIVLGLIFWKLGSFGKSRHEPPHDPAPPEAKIV